MKASEREALVPARFRGRVAHERLLGIALRPEPYPIGATGPDSVSGQPLPRDALCRTVVEYISLPDPCFVGIDIRWLSLRVRYLPNHYENKILIPSGAELLKESEIKPYNGPVSKEVRPTGSERVGCSLSWASGGTPDYYEEGWIRRQAQDYIDDFNMMAVQEPGKEEMGIAILLLGRPSLQEKAGQNVTSLGWRPRLVTDQAIISPAPG